MKNLNKILVLVLMTTLCGLVAVSSLFASTTPSVQSTGTSITFDSGYGIRWNSGIGAFEIFNAAGVSYISTDWWVDPNGGVYAQESSIPDELKALSAQATTSSTYHIMQDISYEETNFMFSTFKIGSTGVRKNLTVGGVLDGRGFILKGFPLVNGCTLIRANAGTIKNINIVDPTFPSTNPGDSGLIVYQNYTGSAETLVVGLIENCTTSGELKTYGTNNTATRSISFGGIVYNGGGTIRDCTNGVQVSVSGVGLGGIACLVRNPIQFINVRNTARLRSGSTTQLANAGGIVGAASAPVDIVGGGNWGDVEGTHYAAGAVSSVLSGGSVLISFFNNFGNITNVRTNPNATSFSPEALHTISSIASGLVGQGIAAGSVAIKFSNNYGNIESTFANTGAGAGSAAGAGILAISGGRIDISNCSNYGSITVGYSNASSPLGEGYIGGIIGRPVAEAVISGCYSEGEFNITLTSAVRRAFYSAGIVGRTDQPISISDCVSAGSVDWSITTLTNVNVGGIAGGLGLSAMVQRASSKMLISVHVRVDGSHNSWVGGVVGAVSGAATFINCAYMGSIIVSTNRGSRLGGIAGNVSAASVFLDSVNSGNIVSYLTEDGTGSSVGGIVSTFDGHSFLSGCTNLGSLAGTPNTRIGGIVARAGTVDSSNVASGTVPPGDGNIHQIASTDGWGTVRNSLNRGNLSRVPYPVEETGEDE